MIWEALTITATVLAILNIGFPFYWRYQDNNALRLVVRQSHVPLMAQDAASVSSRFQTLWDGNEIENPHLVSISFVNGGRRDIETERFNGEPIIVALNEKYFGLVGECGVTKVSELGSPTKIEFGPTLIRTGEELKASFIISGSPPTKILPGHKLGNVKVIYEPVDPLDRNPWWPVWVQLVTSFAMLLVVVGLLQHEEIRNDYFFPDMVLLLLLISITGGPIIGSLLSDRPKRAIHAGFGAPSDSSKEQDSCQH